MAVVLTDTMIDQAEAFRLSKAYRLGPDVALNADPEVIKLEAFASAYGIDGFGIVIRLLKSKLDRGMSAAIAASASYTDRLSHFSDLDRPVVFEDLRSAFGPAGASAPDPQSGIPPPCPSVLPGDDAAGIGGNGGPSAFAPGPGVPGD